MYSPISKILTDYKEGKIEHWDAHNKLLVLCNNINLDTKLTA